MNSVEPVRTGTVLKLYNICAIFNEICLLNVINELGSSSYRRIVIIRNVINISLNFYVCMLMTYPNMFMLLRETSDVPTCLRERVMNVNSLLITFKHVQVTLALYAYMYNIVLLFYMCKQ